MLIFRRLAIALLSIAATAAQAREPGIGPVFQPGSTLGVANAVPLSPGLRIASRSAYHDGLFMGNDGRPTGVRINFAGEAFLVTWVPGWEILGGSYKTSVLAPFANFTQFRDAPVPPAGR